MATGIQPEIEYRQLLEMISAFQWLPEEKRLRVGVDRNRDNGPGNPLFGCLHHYTAAVARMAAHGSLTVQSIHLFLSKLVERYELTQRIDAQSIITELNLIIEIVGVDIELIGVSNAYTTAFVLLVRSRLPLEWNRFCVYVDRKSWKIKIVLQGAQSSPSIISTGECEELETGVLINDCKLYTAPEKKVVGGLARVFENSDFAAYADSVLNEYRDQFDQPEDVTKSEPSSGNQADRSRLKWLGRR